MAILTQDGLSLDFRFDKVTYGGDFIRYEICFRWKGQPIFRDDLLIWESQFNDEHSIGAVFVEDHGEDYFLPLLRKVLQTGEMVHWSPLEEEVDIAIYPGKYFPFLRRKSRNEPYSFDMEDRTDDSGKPRYDPITLIVRLDTFHWKEGSSSCSGPSLTLTVYREDMEKFLAELESEWEIFLKKECAVGRSPREYRNTEKSHQNNQNL